MSFVDEPSQQRVKISHSVNNAPRKHTRIRYAKEGCIDKIHNKMSEFINNTRLDNGLSAGTITWVGTEFTFTELEK